MLASNSQELSNEDLIELEAQNKEDQVASGPSCIEVKQLTSKLLIEAFNHIQAAMQIFKANDPNFERSFEVIITFLSPINAIEKFMKTERKKQNKCV